MAHEVYKIWCRADCPPKSSKSIIKCFENLLSKQHKLKKLKKPHECRKLDNSLFDVLAEEEHRVGRTFDYNFYEEQSTTWVSQMEKVVNKSFLEEEEAKEKIVIKKKKQITSQYSNFSFADPAEVNIAINQVNSI